MKWTVLGSRYKLKGYVETPSKIADLMVQKLFKNASFAESTILDPGCGSGALIEAIVRMCLRKDIGLPRIVGLDANPLHASKARARFAQYSSIVISQDDFLKPRNSQYDFVIANPPYVPITELSEKEKEEYRQVYKTAVGRFDLYLLFFEQALGCLKPGGRLVFITPEKFLYVETAQPLRQLLTTMQVEEIHMVDEDSFGSLVTYPTITTVVNQPGPSMTSLVSRNGKVVKALFPTDGSSWLPYLEEQRETRTGFKLSDVCVRISCGVATGADSVFISKAGGIASDLRSFGHPTVGGRELGQEDGISPTHTILIPYDRRGRLLAPEELGPLMSYLSQPSVRRRLEKRTCASRKPWYSFHENPPLADILRPKIICKDITSRPHFWVDRKGTIVPRHSTYYIVPKDPSRIDELILFLNSNESCQWLELHCQRAANGFLRVQSHVLKQLPIPQRLAVSPIPIAS